MIPRLKEYYHKTLKPELVKQFGYANTMEVPRLDKIVLNMGVGEGVVDQKKVHSAAEELALIAGQRPVITRAKKSIAAFKLREGMPVGCKVTGRPRGNYRKFKISRIALRDLASIGQIPGMVKSSW